MSSDKDPQKCNDQWNEYCSQYIFDSQKRRTDWIWTGKVFVSFQKLCWWSFKFTCITTKIPLILNIFSHSLSQHSMLCWSVFLMSMPLSIWFQKILTDCWISTKLTNYTDMLHFEVGKMNLQWQLAIHIRSRSLLQNTSFAIHIFDCISTILILSIWHHLISTWSIWAQITILFNNSFVPLFSSSSI